MSARVQTITGFTPEDLAQCGQRATDAGLLGGNVR